MGDQTRIAWCDSTWNPWRGCTKVSPGCLNCYAEKLVVNRLGGHWGPNAKRQIAANSTFNAPLRWNKKPWICDQCGWATAESDLTNCPNCNADLCGFHRRRVFSLSLGDWLDPKIPIHVLARALDIIRQCEDIDFLLCTKRPELFQSRTGLACDLENGKPMFNHETYKWMMNWRLRRKAPPNVWILTSVEDQKRADERRPHLLKIPAVVHGLSVEPLLENVTLDLKGIDWVIAGGESGPKSRPCNVDWIRSIRDQCKEASVPCFIKQMGSNMNLFYTKENRLNDPLEQLTSGYPDDHQVHFKHPKGADPDEWPADLRIRSFPQARQ